MRVQDSGTPCLLFRSCVNWAPPTLGPGQCGAGARVQREALSCEHYVREFRPLKYYDRRRTARGGPDRRRAPR